MIRRCGSSLNPAIQSCDSERVRRPANVSQATATHAIQHFCSAREAFDRSRKIEIRTSDPGDQGAAPRQHVLEKNSIKFSRQSIGLAKVEEAALAFRPKHANDFP